MGWRARPLWTASRCAGGSGRGQPDEEQSKQTLAVAQRRPDRCVGEVGVGGVHTGKGAGQGDRQPDGGHAEGPRPPPSRKPAGPEQGQGE